jgi:putative transposase
MNTEHRVSIRQHCRAVGLARSTYRYKPKPKQDEALIDALNALVAKHPAIGFWQAYHRLRLTGRPWNHKRVYRIYTALGLNIRRRAKKRLPARVKQRLFQPGKPTDNPYIESFNGSFRDECLNVHWFLSLDDARTKIETWRRDYNAYRPHQSLDGLSPEMYLDAHHSNRADSLLLTG